MAYLRNRTVNLINLHYGIHALANSMGGLFTIVYLIQCGLSVSAALCAIAAIYSGRFLVRPLVLVLATRLGLKIAIIAGAVGVAVPYPVLAEVDGIGWPLVAYCMLCAIGEALYWTSYHAYFAALGDNEHRGHQVSAREALASIIGIIGPLFGGWSLVTMGPHFTFGLVCLLHTLSALPLLGTPNVEVKRHAPGAYRAAIVGIALFAADGWMAVMYLFTWQIALFLTLDESLTAYGGAMALAALVAAISVMFLGRHVDEGFGRQSVYIAYGIVGLTIVLRAVSVDITWLAIAANAIGAVASSLQPSAMMPAIYNLAKHSPCPLRFQLACEGGWDVGCTVACLIAAGLAAAGSPLSAIIPLGFIGLAASVVLLVRYYASSDGRAVAPAE